MNTKESFLALLARNEDDTPTRLVFADWLEEHGEPEEADRQRLWPAAKAWMKAFCEEYNYKAGRDPAWGEENTVIDYGTLMARATRAACETDLMSFGSNMDMMEAVRERKQEFWRKWSILTGVPIPEGIEFRVAYTCSC